jgi:hypothetical protein
MTTVKAKISALVTRRGDLVKEIIDLELWEMQVTTMEEFRTRHAKVANRYAQLAKIHYQIQRLKNRDKGGT